MYIKELTLKNFRSFSEVSIPFVDEKHSERPSKTIVFIGNNGAGKTAILDALKINLSWLIARINRDKGRGIEIADTDIQNRQTFATIETQLDYDNTLYNWQLAKTLKGRIKTADVKLSDTTKLAYVFRKQLTEDASNANLPLIVYYPVERTVLDIPLKLVTSHNFEQLDGYENALRGVDFRRFFEWFRDREDNEHELIMEARSERLTKFGREYGVKGVYSVAGRTGLQDTQLKAVRTAIKTFMTDFDNLRIQRKPRLQMLVEKNGKTLDVAQLSQGEKSMMALVGDIARRLAMMNPALENPLEGFGIVMIDEIDLHLHPNWQRAIVGNLNRTFPNCQFVLTTHSPLSSANRLTYFATRSIMANCKNSTICMAWMSTKCYCKTWMRTSAMPKSNRLLMICVIRYKKAD